MSTEAKKNIKQTADGIGKKEMTHEKKKKKMKIEKNCLLTRADRISLEFFIVFCDTRKDFSNFSGSLFLFFSLFFLLALLQTIR